MLELHVKFLATLYTSLLMTALVGILVYSGFNMNTPKIKGKVISAQMIDISQIKRSQKPKINQAPAPKKEPIKPEPMKVEPKEQAPVAKPPEPKKELLPPPEIKKIPVTPPKIDKKKVDAQRKKDQDRRKKLEDIRKRKLEAEKRAQKEVEYLEQLNQKIIDEENQELVTTDSQNGDQELDETNKVMFMYQTAVISAVTRNWNKPPTSEKGIVCHVKVRQIPGGGVVDASISNPCNASSLVKKSILDAIKKAEPLPYKGFEKVFSRTATFIFAPED